MQLRVDEPDADLRVLTPTPTVRLAAGLVTFVGVLCALSGFQLFVSVRFVSQVVAVVPWGMLLVGMPVAYVGSQVYRMHAWAARAAAITNALIAVSLVAWTLFALRYGILSCLTVFTPLMAMSGSILSATVLPTCRRADLVREQLRSAGFDLGV